MHFVYSTERVRAIRIFASYLEGHGFKSQSWDRLFDRYSWFYSAPFL